MSNDVFPKSALPSPILDRFRQLLKHREDQIRVSGNEFDDIAITTEEFVWIYDDVLSELTINSKPLITDLTIIAGDFKDHAEGVAQLICSRVLEVPVEQKMPSLYLLDSIVKNIGCDYVRHFASRLPQVFCEVYRQVPQSMHSSMNRLLGTWSTVFPSSVLRQIEDKLQLSSCVNQPSFRVASLRGSESPLPSNGIHNRSRVRGRDEEIVDWSKRRRLGDFNHSHENVASCSSNNGFDRDSPRALIDAYGLDDGQRPLNKKPLGRGRPIVNGAVTKIAVNSWQSSEEEEFDWQDMSPTLAGRKTDNFIKSSNPSTMDINQDGALNLPGTVAALVQKLPVDGKEHTFQLKVNGAPQNGNHFPVSMSAPLPQGQPGLQPRTTMNSVIPVPSLYPLQEQPMHSFEFMNSSFTILNQVPPQQPHSGFVSLPPQLPESRVLPRPADLGYPQNGQIAAPSNIRNNPMPVYHTPPSFLNTSNSLMQFQGPVPPIASDPRPNSHILPLPRSSGSVTNQLPNVNISGLLSSGLLDSLVAQGLLPLMKQSSEKDFIGVEFDPDFLKVRHESAIRALYEDLPRQCTTCGLRFKTQDEHSKHMDWHVTKNRTSKNRKHNPSRKWFVSVSMWLSGTEALGVDAAPGFLSPESTVVENKDDVELAVPADEDQPTCALCGERFEDYYSDETEEWMYRGAVYLKTPSNGTVIGMDRSQLGPIVHAKCRPT